MRVVLQRVSRASVSVDDAQLAAIEKGAVLLVGVKEGDNLATAQKLAQKISGLRVFADAEGKMNLNIQDACGSYLVISQFTLYADTTRGRRPYFGNAAKPDMANDLYESFCNELRRISHTQVLLGQFGADMKVALTNDGPVTIILDSDEGTP